MSKTIRLFLALILVSGLTACAGGAVNPPYHGNFRQSMLHYVAGKGDIFTEIVGNPFNAPQDKVAGVITGTMYGSHFGPAVRFNTKHDPGNPSPYRVVLLFNPGNNVTPDKLCKESQQPSQAASADLRVMLAFCSADDRETSVTGHIAGVNSPEDASFQHLIRQMTMQLFPLTNPDPHGGMDFTT